MMRDLAERAYFHLCRGLGWLLRSARYSTVQIVGQAEVRKRRALFAPFLIAISGPLLEILDTGVRVLPQRDWEEREREIQQRLRGTSIRIDADGTLVLPCLPGETLAAVLENPATNGVGAKDSNRTRGRRARRVPSPRIHARRRHGRERADRSVEGDGGARWFDFETMHDPSRPIAWRRADDVRALAVTCLLRTAPEKLAETLQLILDVYDDEEVTRILAASFNSVWRRPLTFHLAQAGLSFQRFREIARLLARSAGHF